MSETTCSFCGKSEDEVRQLFAGPPPLFICDECVELATDIIAEDSARPQKPTDEPHVTGAELKKRARGSLPRPREAKRHPQPEPVLACAFCGKGKDDVRKLIAGPRVFICDECVRRYGDMLAERERR